MSEMPLRMWLLPLPQLLITYYIIYIIYVYYTDVLTWSLFPFCGSGWCQRFCGDDQQLSQFGTKMAGAYAGSARDESRGELVSAGLARNLG